MSRASEASVANRPGLSCARACSLVLVVVLVWACKRGEDPAGRAPDAALAPRPRPAEVAHLTLKVLGMT